jgi:hypothetical protein
MYNYKLAGRSLRRQRDACMHVSICAHFMNKKKIIKEKKKERRKNARKQT